MQRCKVRMQNAEYRIQNAEDQSTVEIVASLTFFAFRNDVKLPVMNCEVNKEGHPLKAGAKYLRCVKHALDLPYVFKSRCFRPRSRRCQSVGQRVVRTHWFKDHWFSSLI